MLKMLSLSFLVVSMMACASDAPPGMGGGGGGGTTGGGGGGGGGSGGGGGGGSGGSGSSTGKITLSGQTSEQGQSGASALGAVQVAAYTVGNDSTPVAMTTSDASGNYSLTISDATFDGYLKATKSGYTDTYVYPAEPWSADATVAPSMLSSSTFSLLLTFSGADSSKGMIIANITDAAGNPVSGAKISSSPASTYEYSDGSGAPTSSSTGTSSDGVAFFLNVPVGDVTLSATKSGATFMSHVVTARANALTTTVIPE